MTSLTAEEVIRLLDLAPLHFEGGYFRRTYAHAHRLPAEALPPGYPDERPLASAIYYLLTPDTCSRLHRLPTDELWHFYLGAPVALHIFQEQAGQPVYSRVLLGTDLVRGQTPQAVAPAGCWFGAHLLSGGAWALLGCTLAPAFAEEDFQAASPQILQDLRIRHPEQAEILALLGR